MRNQAAFFIKHTIMNTLEIIYQAFQKAYKVTTDSRKVQKDAVFFALKGENFDGNDFALKVAEEGIASLVLCDRNDIPETFPVHSPHKPIQDLSHIHEIIGSIFLESVLTFLGWLETDYMEAL